MKKYTDKAYGKVAMGLASVALTSSTLEAVVVGADFGVDGLSISPSKASATSNGGSDQFYAFGFNNAGQYVTNVSNFSAIGASMGFFAKRKINQRSSASATSVFNGFGAKVSASLGASAIGVVPFKLNSSVMVGKSLTFESNPFARVNTTSATQSGAILDSSDAGPLQGIGRGYVGFRYEVGDAEFLYGWVDMEISEANFTIYGFGLENSLDTAIQVGAIPEVKNSALLLALGAAGMAGYRRKRKVA